MLADSEESVESDEEFYFVDDNQIPTPKKNKLRSSGVKVAVKGPEEATPESEIPSNDFAEDFNITQPDDFARMMTTFDGFDEKNETSKDKENDGKRLRSYKNKLFAATHGGDGYVTEKISERIEIPGSTPPSAIGDSDTRQTGGTKDRNVTTVSDSGNSQNSDAMPSDASRRDNGLVENYGTKNSSSVTSNHQLLDKDDIVLKVTEECNLDNQNIVGDMPADGNNVVIGDSSQNIEGPSQKANAVIHNGLNLSSLHERVSKDSPPSSTGASPINKRREVVHQPRRDESTSSGNPQNNSNTSETLEKPQETYVTVLPSTSEQPDKTVSNDVNLESESDQDRRFSKTGRSRGRCLSYVVFSGGEGHVDLRLRVKSKQDLKKDAQSMFLIWRVNSKI